MSDRLNDSLIEAVQQAIPGARVVRVGELAGGISASTYRVDVEVGGAERALVVRKLGAQGDPIPLQAAAHEFAVREAVLNSGVPSPAALSYGDTPWPHLVLDYVEGAVEVRPGVLGTCVEQLADSLARIHALDPGCLGFLPAQDREVTRLLNATGERDASLDESRVRAALRVAWPSVAHGSSCVLHGDFWPGNVLWREGRLVAVIDWEDACLGNPLADLAIARLDLQFLADAQAVQRFTARYAAQTKRDLTALATWDLFAALRPAGHLASWAAGMRGLGRPDLTLARMTQLHAAFVEQALA